MNKKTKLISQETDSLANPLQNQGKVTLKEIAKAADVSISTVSRALKGGRGISKSVNDRIQNVADQLGYSGISVPDVRVHILSTMNKTEVGHVEFIQGLMTGINAECKALAIVPTLSMVHQGQHELLSSTDKGKRQAYLILSFQDEDLLNQLTEKNIPAVLVNGFDPLMRIVAVAPANRLGGRLAVQHLIDHGHRKILNMTSTDRSTICQRLDGFKEGLAQANLTFDPGLVIDLEAMRTDIAYMAMKKRLQEKGGADFTAVQCCNDSVAFGTMTALLESGFRIPEDISIIGFDDIPTASMASSPLTTIHVGREALGALSVKRLMEQMRNPDDAKTYTECAVKLVQRASTGPVKN